MGSKALTNYLRQPRLIIIIIAVWRSTSTNTTIRSRTHSVFFIRYRRRSGATTAISPRARFLRWQWQRKRKRIQYYFKFFWPLQLHCECAAQANRTEKSIQSNIKVVNKQINGPEKGKQTRREIGCALRALNAHSERAKGHADANSSGNGNKHFATS